MIDRDESVIRLRISGGDLRQMLAAGTSLLEENVELVNSLNVFPVPDGDTGTNMLLTMQSALEEISKISVNDLAAVAHAGAHGSLMGARGNSGVILSQILRGLARAVEGKASVDGGELAAALKEGANTAYRGIGKPVEGTILTVARESSDAAVAASQLERGIAEVLRSAVQVGRRSLEGTPDLLPTLKEAGVVDAGGQGYLLILEGALMFVSGKRIPPAPSVRKPVSLPVAAPSVATMPTEFGYCTEVLIRGERLRPDELRLQLETLGNSVVVAGESDLVHLHVHTFRPGDVLNLASGLGSLEKIKVENMQLQHTAYLRSLAAEDRVPVDRVGVVTVLAGEGLSMVFRDLGAAAVVHGGQTMNPSIAELVHAAASVGFTKVILLPNNPNVIMTAQQAQALSRVELRVVPTRTVCEGVAAMVAFNPDAGLDANLAAMSEAATAVQSIELTRAVRSTRVNGLEIREGQLIGLLNGALVRASDSLEELALQLLEEAQVGEHEVVTVYFGEGVSLEESHLLSASIQRLWPEVQIEVVDGGQPHYPYVISVE